MMTNKIISLYTRANLIVDSVYHLKIPKYSYAKGIKTTPDVCGILLPISGEAKYCIHGEEYYLKKGTILHAGPEMPLDKFLIGEQDWEYILVHFKVLGEVKSKEYIESVHFSVDLSDEIERNIMELGKKMLSYHKRGNIHAKLKNKLYLYELISTLLRTKRESELESEQDKIHYVADYMHEHMEEVLSIRSLADKVHMTDKQLYYYFTKTYGISPKQYLMEIKVKKAEEYLLGTDLLVGEIAQKLGFEDALYFSRMFKKSKKQSPSQFRDMRLKSE